MKKYFCLIIFVITLAAFAGCTQQAVQEPVTTTETTIPTFIPTTELTPEPTPLLTTIITTVTSTVKRTLSPQTKIVTTIHIQNNTFVPQTLTVLPGTGITWINDDSSVQSVKSTGNTTGMFNSGDIILGAQWSYTFGQREGSYEFTSAYHPEMKGTIIIKKGVSNTGVPQ